MDPQDRRVKIQWEEMESLFNLKSKLNQEGAVSSYAATYQQLGWVLQALNPQDGTFLKVDAGADPKTWVNRWCKPGLPAPASDRSGLWRFLGRKRTQSPQPRRAVRTPFSWRKRRENFRKI
jgi:hypothetical protein